MSVIVTISNVQYGNVPTIGWEVGYRIKNSTSPYTVLNFGVADPITFTTSDPAGTLYEGYIKPNCGEGFVASSYFWNSVCNCPDGYTLYPSGEGCYNVETVAATIIHSDYCLATSQNENYGIYGAYIFTGDMSTTYTIANTEYWLNTTNALLNPMNKSGVWIDSDCDGAKNALTSGQETTVAYSYYNSGTPKDLYIGIAADNKYVLTVNGVVIANSETQYEVGSHYAFKPWHIFKVTMDSGNNFINAIGTGDGTVSDSIAMIVYDNTLAELQAATQDADLTILFDTKNLIGQQYKVATCPDGYGMDANYVCNKIIQAVCNS